MKKTNAMRLLDAAKIDYVPISYDTKDGKLDGISVSDKIGKSVEEVYKTLVTVGASSQYYVFVIPVSSELNLKKAAKLAGEKHIEMIAVKDITKVTGYIKGGCSPIGMKKLFKTFIENSALGLSAIIVSAGLIGYQLELSPNDLIEAVNGEYAELI